MILTYPKHRLFIWYPIDFIWTAYMKIKRNMFLHEIRNIPLRVTGETEWYSPSYKYYRNKKFKEYFNNLRIIY